MKEFFIKISISIPTREELQNVENVPMKQKILIDFAMLHQKPNQFHSSGYFV